MEIDKSSGAVNPYEQEGTWYDTADELVKGLRAEIEALDKRKAYLEEIIADVVNRYD